MSDAKILIVEDEGITALDIQNRLISLGYTVPDIASAGAEAVEKAEEMAPDLVLMDIMLPGEIDGVTAAEQIRARFDIPIIYLTAYADDATLQRAKVTEPYGYIVKPFKERELHIAIDMALYKHRMERKLKESEKWFSTTLRSIGDAVITTDKNGLITFMNAVAEGLMGWRLEEILNKKLKEIFNIINKDTRLPVENPVTRVLLEGNIRGLANHTILISRDGTEIPIDDSAAPIKDDNGHIIGVILVFRDITQREKSEQEREITIDFLHLVNVSPGYHDLIREAAGFFQRKSGCEAVGIRQRVGEDYPYFEARGFPPEFVQLENRLCARDDAGEIVRDGSGNPIIECMCGNVISGRFDPSKPFFTKGGSFWTGSTTELLASTTEADRQARTRDRCNGEGYESVALIPLRFGDERMGLLQLNDRRRGMFTPETIALWERLAGYLAVALAKSRAEEAILQAKEEWERTFNTVPDLVAILDPQHKIVRVNQAMADRFGKVSEQCIGLACHEAVHGLSHPPEFCPHAQTCQDGQQHVAEVHEPKLGGDFLVSTTPLRNPQGQLVGTVHVARDITQRKRAEEELRQARDELEQRVQERTAELESAKEELEVINEELSIEIDEHKRIEKELLVAKEAAEEAAKVKAAFMANMSHELRTPMNAVIGMTSLLLETRLDVEQRDFVETIRTGGEALMTLISDILDFSRVEKEKVELEHQPLSLRACVEESLGLVATQANDKGLNLSHTIKYGTPDIIIGDPGRLRQILVNLLSNAVKFTDAGDVSVFVSSKAIESSKHQILFKVMDTGIGIPQDKMDKLFQPFGQLEMTISRKRDGAGLGLAISKGLVELMGGEIWVESKSGVGSTFHFTIPAEVSSGKHVMPDRTTGAASKNLAKQHPLRILVAEDNHLNQKMLLEMLRKMGYRADAVADGREVLQALERQPYDLILMDIRMPGMDGITATREICKRWPNACPKIVAITAYALAGDKDRCLNAGMDGYIAKPVQMDELAEVLKRYTLEAQ
jgi:PAS domain S-box-containing protein